MNEEILRLTRSVQLRTALPALASVGLFVAAMFLYFLPSLEHELVQNKQGASRQLVQAATAVLEHYHGLVQAGVFSEKEAKRLTVEHIRDMRFGPDRENYFWINDLDCRMVMHPYRPDLEGTDLSGFHDQSGTYLFKEFVRVAREIGEGSVTYEWQHLGDDANALPKMSFVKVFEPWGWIVGTGVYMLDVNQEARLVKRDIILIALGVTAVSLLMALWVIAQARQSDRERQRTWEEREKLLKELAGQREKYRGIFENSVEGIYQTAISGEILSANPAMAHILGCETSEQFLAEANTMGNQFYVQPERRDLFLNILRRDGLVIDFESEVRTIDGRSVWVLENARAVRDTSGAITHVDGIMLDITKRRHAEIDLERQRAHFKELFESSPLGIVLSDASGSIIKANRSLEQMFGHPESSLVGLRIRKALVPEDKLSESETLQRVIGQGKSVNKETVRLHADGSLIPVNLVGYPVRIGAAVSGAFLIFQDITERKNFERQLSHQAFHDSLTALPNRTLYMERLNRAVQRGRRRDDYNFAAMMIDLNRFKRINDTLGHLAGDQLLVGVALRILSCIRTVDTVARLGGDEFAILLEEFENSREVIQVANRIRDVLAEPFFVDENEVHTGASVGIVLDTREYHKADEILRDADIAMYQAKGRGKDRLVFSKRMHTEALQVGQLETELRLALAKNQLMLNYQPIVNVETGELQGFEALVRWNHPAKGVLLPMEFIPLAEETGLIVPLGRWVLREACTQMATWCKEEDDRCSSDVSMSVNISARQLAQTDLVEFIKGLLEELDLDPPLLKLEITETVLMDDREQAAIKMERIKALGVQIMIDDFGTGYSSLSYLQQFPVDYLKIDKAFISGQGDKRENREIVNTIILLARSLGLKVVAEGVEQPEHLDMLRELNCDDAQGFMFSRPVDKIAATDILHEFLDMLRKRA